MLTSLDQLSLKPVNHVFSLFLAFPPNPLLFTIMVPNKQVPDSQVALG